MLGDQGTYTNLSPSVTVEVRVIDGTAHIITMNHHQARELRDYLSGYLAVVDGDGTDITDDAATNPGITAADAVGL